MLLLLLALAVVAAGVEVDVGATGTLSPLLAEQLPAFAALAMGSNVTKRGLVTREVTAESVLREQDRFYVDTMTPNFAGETLAYLTPWNGDGAAVARLFAGGNLARAWLREP